MPKKASSRASAKPLYREKIEPKKTTGYLDIWWHLQKPYCGYFSGVYEARLQGMSRNATIIEIQGTDSIGIGKVVDYWRRDNSGNPMPFEWQTPQPKDILEIEHTYFTAWWHIQKPYAGVFAQEGEANLQAMSRNGVVVDILGENISIGKVLDYYRKNVRRIRC